MAEIHTIDIAQEIMEELDNPTDLSAGVVHFWLLQNVGELNNRLGTSYSLTDAGNDITPLLGENEKNIFKTIYFIYFYDKKIRSGLGASGFEAVQEITSDGATIRKIDRVRLAQTYIQMKKEEQNKLKTLINNYKTNNIGPVQVTGDDYFSSEPIQITTAFNRSPNG